MVLVHVYHSVVRTNDTKYSSMVPPTGAAATTATTPHHTTTTTTTATAAAAATTTTYQNHGTRYSIDIVRYELVQNVLLLRVVLLVLQLVL